MTTETGDQPVELAGRTTVEAVAERIRELETKSGAEIAVGSIKDETKLSFESLESQDEKVVNNPKYLEHLGKLDQEYIDERLDREGRVRVPNAAVISIDRVGFFGFTQENLRASWGDQRGSFAAKKVVDRIVPLRDEILNSVHLFGGEADQFLGDGMNVMFRGGTPKENVMRAVQAAELLRTNIKEHYQFDIRIGIDVGDVELVAYGNELEKRADMTGSAVRGAEKVQSQAETGGRYNVALSESAYNQTKNVQFTVLENGVYALGEIGRDELVSVVDWASSETKEIVDPDPVAIERAVRTREKFLSKSRRKELRSEFLYGDRHKPTQDARAVSTMFVKLNADKMDYQELNPVMTEVFEIASRLRGKVDKVHNDTVMINFIAHLNDVNSVEASKLIADYLTNERVGFTMAASRSEALVLTIGGISTVYSDGVNRAQRLLKVNNPGNCLVVDKSVMDRVLTHKVVAESIPPVLVKGSDEPVERFVIKKIERSYELPKGKHLAGRETEIKVLEDDFELARKEGQNRILIGEPGVGKSALTAEFLARKREGGLTVMVGRAEARTQGQAFAVWRDLLESSLSLKDISTKDKVMAIEGFYRSNCPELMESLALLNPILGTSFKEGDTIQYLEVAERDQLRADFVVETIKSLTSIGVPTAVLLEDLHFFDSSSEQLAKDVMQRIKKSDIYFVLTTWPEDEHQVKLPREEFMREVSDAKTLELGGLPVFGGNYEEIKDTVEFEKWWQTNKEVWWQAVDAFIDLDRSDFEKNEMGYRRIFTKLAEKTDGNFLYLGSAIYYLAIYQGTWRYFEEDLENRKYRLGERIQDEQFTIIPSMEAIEQAKLDTLDIETKNLLQDAAVIGLVFTPDVLSHITGVSPERIKRNLEYAVVRGFIKELGGGQYMFAHGAIQNAIYASTGGDLRRRQLKHRELAQYFEKTSPDDLPLLVRHYRNSDDYLKAMGYLDQYADRLKEQVLWGSSLDQINYASKIFDKVRERGWKIINVDATTYKGEQVQLNPEQIEKMVHGEIDRMMTALILQRKIGDRNKTLPIIERAQELFGEFHGRGNVEKLPMHDRLTWIRLLAEEGRERGYQGDKNNATTIFEEAFSLAEKVDCHKMADLGLEAECRATMYKLYFAHGITLGATNEFKEALVSTEKALYFSNGLADELAIRNQMVVYYEMIGKVELAEREYLDLIQVASEHYRKGDMPTLYSNLAELYLHVGKDTLAEDYFNKAYDSAKGIGQKYIMAKAQGSLAFLYRDKENYNEAFRLFQEVKEDFISRGQKVRVMHASVEVAFCAIKLGRFHEARELLIPVQTSGTQLAGRGYTIAALGDLINNGEDDLFAIKNQFEVGIALLKDSNRKTSIAFDSLHFGEALLERGLDEGMEHVLRAKEIYEEIGESSQMSRIEKILEKYRVTEVDV